MTTFLRISGRDPLVARDGRPFGEGQGNRMRSSGWLTSSVVAGSFRTALAKAAGRGFDSPTQNELLKIDVAGVLPLADGQLYLPAPYDCVLDDKGEVWWARPEKMKEGEGANWPEEGLRPVLLDAKDDFKPEAGPMFWPLKRYAEWLCGQKVNPRTPDFLGAPVPDLRDHVSLNSDSGAAAEDMLFTTVGIGSRALPKHGCTPGPTKPTGAPRCECFTEIELSARVEEVPEWGRQALGNLSVWHPLGGERRLAHWRTSEDGGMWECPKDVREKLGKTRQITMTLATPAIFRDGWKPGWLDGRLTGSPTNDGPRLTLVGACIQRWRAVSGWSYKDKGPKAIRRMVPAGGVYFFESERDDNSHLARHWLRSVSDDPQGRLDGFGLAVWGTW
jgi:CRISPR-associated protein Cmr3